MSSLFGSAEPPLAERMKPESLDRVTGQDRTVNVLKRLKKPVSLIFYGPPGTGKTSISMILSRNWGLPFRYLNAASAGVKDIKDIAAETERTGSICVFLDEIHRFSSSQQDSLLDSVEKGRIILMGATAENPAFRVNRALLSRCQIFRLYPLERISFFALYERAVSDFSLGTVLDEHCIDNIINFSGGDARKFLNFLELLDSLDPPEEGWTPESVSEEFSSQVISYDKNKENHYDYISAFIKSVRGSDPDAALLYLAAMLEGGEDPLFIMRRLLILASEDVGNASIQGLMLAEAGLSALEKIGMPEGRIILSQVTCFLAASPKSNASYQAMGLAQEFVEKNSSKITVPLHLRNAPTFLHRKEGNSKGYQYPHDFSLGFILENYFPDELKENPPQFYFPTERGTDKTLKDRLESIWSKDRRKKYSQ
ncbi:MAG TPA: replication-associated recombination protein A [Leptospiraceae bacterium]|nr:replication-associated recombination protein A [Leptospiraceae bacterium]